MEPRHVVKQAEALRSERRNLDGTYDLVDKFIVPGRGRLFSRDEENAVDWRRRDLFDDTAVIAAQTLASSINGSLTSPSTRWFTYRFRDPALNDSQEASAWLEECQERVFYALYESNFSTEAAEFYLDAVSFGTPCMAHEYTVPTPKAPEFQFRTLPTRDFYFEEDVYGRPTAVYQFIELTSAQIAQRFPERVPENIYTEATTPGTSLNKHTVVRAVVLDVEKQKALAKMDVDFTKPVAQNLRPYQEMYVLQASSEQLNDPNTGYHEMPAYVLRWGRVAGSKFGYSPAINAMPNILTLNQLVEYTLAAAEKVIDPPLLAVNRGVLSDVDLRAGGVTNVRNPDALRPLQTGARFDVSELNREHLINSIRQNFFVDQLELKESPAMTATEVNVRYELMQRLLGPTLSRMKSDFLDPLLQRSFFIMMREGALPEMPESVQGAPLDIEYIGPMARNQKLDEVVAIERTIQNVNMISPFKPDVVDVYDWDELSRISADRLGLPAKGVKERAAVDKERKVRAEQQAKQQQMEGMERMMSAAKDGAAAAKLGSEAGVGGGMMEGM